MADNLFLFARLQVAQQQHYYKPQRFAFNFLLLKKFIQRFYIRCPFVHKKKLYADLERL